MLIYPNLQGEKYDYLGLKAFLKKEGYDPHETEGGIQVSNTLATENLIRFLKEEGIHYLMNLDGESESICHSDEFYEKLHKRF